MIRTNIVISIFSLSIVFAGDKIFKYYSDFSPVIVDDISINLKSLENSGPNKGIDTVFIKLTASKGFKNLASWDYNAGNTEGGWFRNLFGLSRSKSKINVQGRSARKFNDPFLVPGKKDILAIPVKSGKIINKKDRLILNKIRINCVGETRAKLSVSVDRKAWQDLGYDFIFSSQEELEIESSKIFFAEVKNRDTVLCDFTIKIPVLAYIDNEYPIGITIMDNAMAEWGEIDGSQILVKVNGNMDSGLNLSRTASDSLLILAKSPIISERLIQLSQVPVVKRKGAKDVSFLLSAKVSDPAGTSNLKRIWHGHQPDQNNGLYWKQAKISIIGGGNTFYYNDTSAFSSSLTLLLEGDGFLEMNSGDYFELALKSDNVYWSGEELPKGKNFDFTFSKNNRSLICQRNDNSWVSFEDKVIIGEFVFKADRGFTGRVDMDWYSPMFDRGNRQKVQHFFIIGQPRMYLEKDNYIFSNDQNPALNKIIFNEDINVSTLQKGDIIIYELSDRNLRFNKQRKDRIKIVPPYIAPIISGKENEMSFRVNKELPAGQKITINYIPLLPIQASKVGERVSGSFRIESDRLINKSSYDKLFNDNSFVHISRVDLSLVGSKEYIKNQNKTEQTEEFPVIRIYNSGNSNIFRDQSIKLYIENTDGKVGNNIELKSEGIALSTIKSNSPIAKISQGEKHLEINLENGIPANDTLFIRGVKIQLRKPFDEVPLSMLIESGDKTLSWKSSEVLVFSAPSFQSSDSQVLFPSRKNRDLFTFYIDMRHLSDSFNALENLSIILPDNVPVQWSKKQNDVVIGGPGKEYLVNTPDVLNDAKILNIRKNDRAIIEPDSLVFSISFLKHDILYHNSGTKLFNVQLSIDNGKTVCAVDPYTKRIVSNNNKASINDDRITRDYYPFKKGKTNSQPKSISLQIKQKNNYTNNQWDIDRIKVTPADRFSEGYLKTFNFEEPVLSKNNTKFSFEILNDIYDQAENAGHIQFDESMVLRGIFLKNKDTPLDDIYLTLLTPFGYEDYYYSRDRVEFRKKLISDGELEVTIGLKNYNREEQLSDPDLRNWYWLPDRYFSLLDKSVKAGAQLKNLERLETILVNHYNKYEDETEFDWIFWYYLSWVKLRADEINYKLDDLQSRINKRSFKDDFSRSKQLGFYGRRIPGEDYDYEEERRREFEDAYALFKKAKESGRNELLFAVEDAILSSLNKDGITNYIKAANYSLLGQVSARLDDQTKFKISTKSRKKTATYPERILYNAQKAIFSPTDRKLLQDWEKIGPSRIMFIDDYEDFLKAEDADIDLVDLSDNSVDLEPKPLDRRETPSYYSEAEYRLKVRWYPDNISRRFRWTFKLKSPRIEIDDTDSGEKIKIIVGKTSKNNHAFDKNLTLYGGGEYALIFSPRRNLAQYTFYSILGGVLTYVWLL